MICNWLKHSFHTTVQYVHLLSSTQTLVSEPVEASFENRSFL